LTPNLLSFLLYNSFVKYTPSKIRRAFGHRLIGSSNMERVVIETLLIFPDESISQISKKRTRAFSRHHDVAFWIDILEFLFRLEPFCA